MNEPTQAIVMTLCPQEIFDVPEELKDCFWQVQTGREALAIMRMFHMDLFLISLELPDLNPWEFVRSVQLRSTGAKWALLARRLEVRDEINARMLGVLSIYHEPPRAEDLYRLAQRLRRNNRYTRVSV